MTAWERGGIQKSSVKCVLYYARHKRDGDYLDHTTYALEIETEACRLKQAPEDNWRTIHLQKGAARQWVYFYPN